MDEAFLELGTRQSNQSTLTDTDTTTYRHKPRIITLGGDHSIALPALRALHKIHNRAISVVHFDAHLDTWDPAKYPSSWLGPPNEDGKTAPLSFFTHGSMFWLAARERLIANGSSVHAGLRTRLTDAGDLVDDDKQGWTRITADDIDDIGTSGVIKKIMERVGMEDPVYLSVDIDVIDPGLAPGTGTPEPGGWTTRELIRILRGIEGLNLVGADIVEVAPAYDGVGEVTALAAAQVAYEIVTSMVKRGLAEDKVSGGASSPDVRDEL